MFDANEPVFKFPACRGIQGSRVFYAAVMPLSAVSRLIQMDDGDVLDRSQRDIDAQRVKSVKNYMTNNPKKWVLPSLSGNCSVDPEFTESIPGSNVGIITLPMDAEIKVFDGQHRSMGIIETVRDDVNFRHQNITLQLFTRMTKEERQQAFTDINLNAKPVSKNLSMVYDHRNATNQRVAAALQDVGVWSGCVEWQKTSCTAKNAAIFPFKSIVEAFKTYLGAGSKNEITNEQAVFAANFFKTLSPIVEWFTPAEKEGWTAEHGREAYITYHVIGLKALALWGRKVLDSGKDLDDCIAALSAHADCFSRKNPDWTGKCQDEQGRMKANREALHATVLHLCNLTNVRAGFLD